MSTTNREASDRGAAFAAEMDQQSAAVTGGDWRSAARWLASPDSAVQVSIAITLLLVALYGPRQWYVSAPLTIAVVVGLVWQPALRWPRFWLVVAASMAAGVFLHRLTADNHKYLMVYWACAIWLGLEANDRGATMRDNARLLIGLAFACATAWKIASPDFLSGAFLEFELLLDERFAWFTQLVAGVPAEALAANREALHDMHGLTTFAPERVLATTPAVGVVATALSWFTVVIEGWIGLAFLLKRPRWLHRWRDAVLLAFVFSTYAVATVPGFAYLLIAMGIAQCERSRAWVPWAYLAAAIVLQVYRTPLGEIATHALTR